MAQFCGSDQFCVGIPIDAVHLFRQFTKSGRHGPELLDCLFRNWWTAWSGISGFHAPDFAWYAIEDKRSYKKRVEVNKHVSTHVRFIWSFISLNNPQKPQQLEMFPDSEPGYYKYDFLWTKNLLELDNLPRLPDLVWKPISPSEIDAPEKIFSI